MHLARMLKDAGGSRLTATCARRGTTETASGSMRTPSTGHDRGRVILLDLDQLTVFSRKMARKSVLEASRTLEVRSPMLDSGGFGHMRDQTGLWRSW